MVDEFVGKDDSFCGDLRPLEKAIVGNCKNGTHISMRCRWSADLDCGVGTAVSQQKERSPGAATTFPDAIQTVKTCFWRRLTAQRHVQGACPGGSGRRQILCEKGVEFSPAGVAQQHRHFQAFSGSGKDPSFKD
jgi:hypothetical protein